MQNHSYLRGLLLVALLLVLAVSTSTSAFAQAPAAGGVSPTTLTLPSGPGSVAGLADAASVNVHSAQVGYSVPISLPQDGNLSPSLALSYSGDLGNGSMGIGWSMARPSIHRSTRQGVPSYTSSDELILQGVAGGGRLIPIGGNEYRLEGAGNSVRILKVGGRFELTDPDGTQYFFGLFQATGRQAGLGAPYAWFLEMIVDNAGHSAKFTYRKDKGEVYLDSIVWGPESGGTKVYHVDMNYEDRSDPTISFMTGLQVITALRLQSIAVTSFGEELRRYNLSYDDSFAVTRLASVTMTGRGGEGSLPTTSFEYSSGTPSEVFELSGTGGWHLDTRGVGIYDIDGDGMSDLLRMEVANHGFRKNHGGSFSSAGTISGANAIAMSASTFMDLDGDARPELVRIVADTWRVYNLEGDRWVAKGEWPGTEGVPLGGPGVVRADLNGDGRTDIIRAATSGIIVHFATGNGLAPGVLLGSISPGDSPVEPGRPNVRFHDVNGDGLADVVWMTDGWMKYLLGRGDGTFKSWGRVFYPWGQGAFDLSLLRLADLNRDGLMDLVRIHNGKAIYYAGDADFRFTVAAKHLDHPATANVDTTITIADMNGNGSQDLVWSSPTGMWALDLAGATSQGMLSAIDNGLGGRTVYEYQGSGALAVADENRGDPWSYKLPQAIPVPTRTLTYPGNSEPRRITTYSVRDGYWDGKERRFAGFLLSRVQSAGLPLAETAITETRYRIGLGNNRVLRGVPWHSHVESGTGDIIEVNEKIYETRIVAGLPADNAIARKAALLEDRSFHYEGQPEAIQTLTTYEYDLEVRPIRVMAAGRLDMSGDETIAETVYADDETTWIKNRTCEEFLYDAEDLDNDGVVTEVGLLNHTRTIFGDESNLYDDGTCTVGKGWVRRKDGELFEGGVPRWVELEYSEFDARGNVTMTRAGGVERTLGYDAIGLFPTSESMLNDEGTSLTWTATWDNALGVAITNTDPNDITSHINYDSLGRVESMSMGAFAPHVFYRYEWQGPAPKTYSYTLNGVASQLASFPNHEIGAPWSESVSVANGIGEGIYSASRLDSSTWIISGWQDRDKLGRTTFVAEAFEHTGAALPTVRPSAIVGQSLEYDSFGRTVRQSLPTGDGKSMQYAAFSVTVNADDMAPVTSSSDGLGRILHTERIIPSLSGGASTTELVDATYDGAGRILAMTLQGGSIAPHAFAYDSLGRLIFADDPDIGQRNLEYNDVGQLIRHTNAAGQDTTFTYDILGRLSTQTGEAVTPPVGSPIPATTYAYHYDTYPAGFSLPGGALPGAGDGYLAGRLAAVQEPDGSVTLAYDEFGRPRATGRTIAGQTVSEFLTLGMSGQVQSVMYGHDLSVSLSYDGVGRAVGMSGPGGMLWQADEYDSGGRLVRESFGNGVTQVTTRDVLGLPSRVQVERPVMAGPLYDVAVTRNAWTGILSATDSDGVGLNHSASFTYDGAARLTDASIGTGSEMYNFGYRYDGLQNMTLRTQAGPSTLDMVAGTYQYGEAGAGPRQLTSVVDAQSTEVANFTYDAAGRMTEDTGKLLTYNGLDQLVHVDLPGAMVPLLYSYGYNGQRTYTQHADGTEEYNFTESIRQEDDLRHHYLKIGSRTVARISMRDLEAGGGSGGGLLATPPTDTQGSSPLRTLLLLLLFAAATFAASRRGRKPRGIRAGPAWAMAPLLVLFASNISCGALFGSTHQATWTTDQTIYFHQGFSAGPTMMTDEAGNIFEERRYEPFGVDIDAYSGVAGGIGPSGSIDFAAEPTNILNKASDRDTKWSYHGARWVAPQTARWHTPDPIVKAPDAKFMAEPWGLHPYQYVKQNPVMYWDPDGRDILEIRVASALGKANSGTVSRVWGSDGVAVYKGMRKDDSNYYVLNSHSNDGSLTIYFDTLAELESFDIDTQMPFLPSYDWEATAHASGILIRRGDVQAAATLAWRTNTQFLKDPKAMRASAVNVLLGAAFGVVLRGGLAGFRAWRHGAKAGGARVDAGKFDYLFGNARGAKNAAHNLPRTNQNALQMKRLGVHDNAHGRSLLQAHFDDVVSSGENVVKTWSNTHGTFETRISLFAGPSGKFAKLNSTWEVLQDGTRRLTTVIPMGGP